MEQKILLIDEVALRLGVSPSTIRRYLQASRLGQGNFPLPISPPGCKCRWLSSDIEAYLQSQSSIVASMKMFKPQEVKSDKKSFLQRQLQAEIALTKHRKPK